MDTRFIVVEWDKVEAKLSDVQLDLFYELLNEIDKGELEHNEYFVITSNEKKIIDSERKKNLEKKKRLLKILNELKKLSDVEVAHAEADEALLSFIDDKEIERAFEEIGKGCY